MRLNTRPNCISVENAVILAVTSAKGRNGDAQCNALEFIIMDFQTLRHPNDILAFPNETRWNYARDPATGRQTHQWRTPPPNYTLRCFVMVRAVKLFRMHSRFEPSEMEMGEGYIRTQLRLVLGRNPRQPGPEFERIVFQGYPDLFSFSRKYERLIKAEAGAAWRSYFQRGHWRMVLPFTRAGQEAEAAGLMSVVRGGQTAAVHLFTFPALTVNHAMLLFEVTETRAEIIFKAYDPNNPKCAQDFTFNRVARSFHLPATGYFVGGRVNAIQVYCGLFR